MNNRKHFEGVPFAGTYYLNQMPARPVSYSQTGETYRVVMIDAMNGYWLTHIGSDGNIIQIMAGPITAEAALHAAELIITGTADHHSVTGLINNLALGLIAQVAQTKRVAA